MNISKSKYTRYKQCPKMLWMDTHMPQEAVKDESAEARFKEGNKVGRLAMEFIGDHVECSAYRRDGSIYIPGMLDRTREAVARWEKNICEAAFSVNGCYCSVDILHRKNGGYSIYEVKSGVSVKDVNLWDIAFQKYVLTMYGIKVRGTYIVHVNGKYVRHGDLDLKEFFVSEDVSEAIQPFYDSMEADIAAAKKYVMQEREPEMEPGLQCRHPYGCPYWTHCMTTPPPSVFDLYRIPEEDAFAMYSAGVRTLQDVYCKGFVTDDPRQERQLKYANGDLPMHVDKEGLKGWLSGLHYPLYFLDFETTMSCIPMYDGTRPYQQVPCQYSLHIQDHEGAPLVHREFLGDGETDPRRAIAESLVANIPAGGTLIAYNMAFEQGCIKDLADYFPDLAAPLMQMHDSFADLIDPFRAGYVYCREMGGSFSIKSVLPALFPDDPELSYDSLDGVHNGGQAQATYMDLADMPDAEREKARENLLAYCCLDSYGMVRLLQKLRELAA